MTWALEMGGILLLSVLGVRLRNSKAEKERKKVTINFSRLRYWQGEICSVLLPSGYENWLNRRLSASGNPKGLSVNDLFFRQIVLAFLFLLIGVILPQRGGVWFTAFLSVLGFALPLFQLQSPIREREKAVRRAVRNWLVCLIPLLEGTLHFQTTLFTLFRRTQGPLGEVGQRIIVQVTGGRSLREALWQEAQRVQVREFVQLSRVLMDGDRYGPQEMAEKLRELKTRMDRDYRRKAKKEIRDVMVRLFFIVLLFIFVPIVVLGFIVMLQSLKQNIPL